MTRINVLRKCSLATPSTSSHPTKKLPTISAQRTAQSRDIRARVLLCARAVQMWSIIWEQAYFISARSRALSQPKCCVWIRFHLSRASSNKKKIQLHTVTHTHTHDTRVCVCARGARSTENRLTIKVSARCSFRSHSGGARSCLEWNMRARTIWIFKNGGVRRTTEGGGGVHTSAQAPNIHTHSIHTT